MKQAYHTTFTGTALTPADLGRWVQSLLRLHGRIAPRFARRLGAGGGRPASSGGRALRG